MSTEFQRLALLATAVRLNLHALPDPAARPQAPPDPWLSPGQEHRFTW